MDFTQFAKTIQANVAQVIIGKADATELLLVALLVEGHVLMEDVPGIGKTTLAKALAAQPRLLLRAHPVHARPAAQRCDRAQLLQPEDAGVRVPPRPGLQPGAAGRRDQPRHPAHAIGAAGGDAGAPGDRGRPDLSAAPAVPGAGHPEPHRAGGHLSAARGAAGPLPDAGQAGLSHRRAGGGHPVALPARRSAGRAEAGGVGGRCAGAAGQPRARSMSTPTCGATSSR